MNTWSVKINSCLSQLVIQWYRVLVGRALQCQPVFVSLLATGGLGSSTPNPLLAVRGVINCVGGKMAQGFPFAFCATGTYPPCSGNVANKTLAGQRWVLMRSFEIAWEWVLLQYIVCWNCRAGANNLLREGFCEALWLFKEVYGLTSNRLLWESLEVRVFTGPRWLKCCLVL